MIQENELQSLKEQILTPEPAKEQKTIRWGSGLITIVMAVLTIFSIIQTVQSASILNKIKSGEIKSAGTNAAGAGSVQTPSSIQNLPNMVGGC